MFSFVDGSVFDLVTVDLAEYSTGFPTPFTLLLVGYRVDGSTVNGSFTTDGIIDGTGPLADFQTFTFGPEFSNLLRVEIPTYGWSLDNLHLNRQIPEPNAAALVLFGASLVGWHRVRHGRRKTFGYLHDDYPRGGKACH